MTAVAVLCGGGSTRLGRPKILEVVDGLRCGVRIIQACRAAGLGPVLAVTGEGGPDAAALRGLGFDAVIDDTALRPPGERGPLCGVVAALRHGMQQTVFLPSDHPAMPPALLRWLAGQHGLAVALADNPLCVALDPLVLPLAQALLDGGRTGVRRLLREAGARKVGQGAVWMLDPFGGHKLGFNSQEQLQDVTRAVQGAAHAPGLLWAVRPGQQAPQQ